MPRGYTPEWTDEMKATAVGMRRAGIPAHKIAKRLGRTEREVAGLFKRLHVRARLDGHAGRASCNPGHIRADCYITHDNEAGARHTDIGEGAE